MYIQHTPRGPLGLLLDESLCVDWQWCARVAQVQHWLALYTLP